MADQALPLVSGAFPHGGVSSARPRSLRMRVRQGDALLQTLYVCAIIAAGTLVIVESIGQVVARPLPVQCFILATLTALGGAATLRMPDVPVSFSVSDSFTITAAVLFGPAAGALTVAIDSLVMSFRLAQRKNPLRRLLFNAAAPAFAMWIAAHVFFRLAHVGLPLENGGPLGQIVAPLAVFAALYFVLNTGLIAGVIALEQPQTLFAIWRQHFFGLWLTYFGGAAVATLLIVLVYSRGLSLLVFALVAPIPLILYATFKTTIGRVEDQLGHLRQVNRMHASTIETLAQAIDAKDQVTHGHIRRVQHAAVRLASALGVDEAELRAIEAASLLHDLGKLAVPEHILNKPGKLTPAEFETMKRHAAVGADILSSVEFPYPVVPIVRHHHEHWDGRGYPDGLSGQAIPIGARILSVVDCFDALTSDRPYRPRLPTEGAFQILRDRSGTMYDPDVVARFIGIHEGMPPELAPTPALAAIAMTGQTEAASTPAHALPRGSVGFGAFLDLGGRLATSADAASVVGLVHDTLGRLMPAACTAIFTYSSADDRLTAQWVAGLHGSAIQGLVIPVGQRLTGWVAANQSTIVNSDAALDLGDLTRDLAPRLSRCLSTVIRADTERIGVLTIYSSSAQPFDDAHVVMVEALASRLAPIVQRAAPRSG